MCLSALAYFICGTYSPGSVEGAVPIFDPRKCLEDNVCVGASGEV